MPGSASIGRVLYAVLLISPCLLFILMTFALPIAAMLFRSVEDPELAETLPRTAAAFQAWDGVGLPPEDLVRIFVAGGGGRDGGSNHWRCRKAAQLRGAGVPRAAASDRARPAGSGSAGPSEQRLSETDARWQDPLYWHAIKTAAPRFTARYFLATAGLQPGSEGTLVQSDPSAADLSDPPRAHALESAWW